MFDRNYLWILFYSIVAIDNLEKRVDMNAEKLHLRQVCLPKKFNSDDTNIEYIPECHYFDVPNCVMKNIHFMKDAYSHPIFCIFWKKYGKRAHRQQEDETKRKSPLDIETVIEIVWCKAYHRLVYNKFRN